MKRRTFLASTAIAMPALLLGQTPSRKLRVAVAGMGGRGTSHAVELAKLADVEVAYVCDPDEKRAAAAASAVEKRGFRAPKTAPDFRALLDDRSLDGLSVATPNHWHAPAALLAMSAGKHVYLEKPCSHNAREGELLIEAARKHKRIVQHGTQRRSWPAIREAMERLRSGELGAVRSAHAYYFNARPTIGKGKPGTPPCDWSLWQGPAPEREFRDNFLHYNWHWFWHWGGGEMANNGVHMLDLCRWGLGVDAPKHVTSGGEKLGFPDDDQETPDTNTATFDFGTSTITWECRSWANRTPLDPKHDVQFSCEKGTLLIGGNGYTIHDMKGVETAKGTAPAEDKLHFQNWVDAIRDGAKLYCDIEEGHKSTLLCHLANIAWRNRKTVAPGDDTAKKFWSREYRAGWEPKA